MHIFVSNVWILYRLAQHVAARRKEEVEYGTFMFKAVNLIVEHKGKIVVSLGIYFCTYLYDCS